MLTRICDWTVDIPEEDIIWRIKEKSDGYLQEYDEIVIKDVQYEPGHLVMKFDILRRIDS